MYRKLLILAGIITIAIVLDLLVGYVQLHQGCSPGPKPSGMSQQSWNAYAPTVCNGVG